jgi:hypothetical protein
LDEGELIRAPVGVVESQYAGVEVYATRYVLCLENGGYILDPKVGGILRFHVFWVYVMIIAWI